MGRFNKLSPNVFKEILNSEGIIVNKFDIENADDVDTSAIIATTSGGITVNCTPTYSDLGEDIDNCPANTMELKRITGYDCNIGFTSLNFTANSTKMFIGAADVDTDTGKVTLRRNLKLEDFEDFWVLINRSDEGLFAVHLKNGLSTSGLALSTTKDGKGTNSVTITGHVSINNVDEVPMEFYVQEGETA